MSDIPEIVDATRPTDEQKQLVALFNEMDKQQLDFLDQAGRRIVELCAGLLAIVFGVMAFGDQFPPSYLKGNLPVKALIVAALALYLGAMLAGMFAVQPRDYRRYLSNLTGMKKELQKITAHKSRWLQIAGILFVLGSLALVVLVGVILFAA